MSKTEQSLPSQNGIDRFSGRVFAGVAEIYLRGIKYEGAEHIQRADEMLQQGNSVLFVSDHPSTLTTTWTANVATMIPSRQVTGILMKDAFAPESKKQIGYVLRQIVAHHNAEALYVKTPRYEEDEEVRAAYNEKAIARGNEILKTPGGCLFLYAQGTRGKNMQQARSGLANFASLADYVVPMTTVSEGRGRVVIHPPIPGKEGIVWCVKQFGVEGGPRIFSDLVMTIIATAQPEDEKKGVYKELSSAIEKITESQELQIDIFDLRIQQVLSAYLAWKQNEFK